MIMSYDSPELLLISSNIFYWPWKTWKQSSTEHVPVWHSPPSMVNLTYPASSETWPNLLIKCGHWTSSINGYKWCFYWCFDGTSSIKFDFLDDTQPCLMTPSWGDRPSASKQAGAGSGQTAAGTPRHTCASSQRVSQRSARQKERTDGFTDFFEDFQVIFNWVVWLVATFNWVFNHHF